MDNIIGFSIFFLILFFFIFLINHQRQKEARIIINDINDKVKFKLTNISCRTFNSGAKGGGFNFNRCDLYLISDALIVFGYKKIGSFRYLSIPLAFTKRVKKFPFSVSSIKVVKPKKINLNSYNGDVYIEFEVKSWMTTIVEIRLKNISIENKEEFKEITNFVL